MSISLDLPAEASFEIDASCKSNLEQITNKDLVIVEYKHREWMLKDGIS